MCKDFYVCCCIVIVRKETSLSEEVTDVEGVLSDHDEVLIAKLGG